MAWDIGGAMEAFVRAMTVELASGYRWWDYPYKISLPSFLLAYITFPKSSVYPACICF
ncbi:hypothetical protein [Flavobacterium gyeonganense]|uniref:Uncharacterized protein n=1 Tax=Flavobacterium gyeonganense TaxID=1310418 RepID=A0ABV5HDR6_9FLAO|nr:hypothetical protein [Flavobacterium gyeonganense]